MDQVRIGKFIASLRRQRGLTQETLGGILGVTNKTVSRWETGVYMPDIETLQLLSNEFHVSINELLAGEFLSDEDFRKKADENVVAVSRESMFSLEEKRAYFIKKWRREHIALFIVLAVIWLAVCALPLILGRIALMGLCPIVWVIEYAWQNNRMMIYVGHHLYD